MLQSNTTLSDGARAGFLVAGQGSPVILLLHAFPLAKEMWLPQLEALSAQARLIALDLPGFGGSSPLQETPSVEAMARRVLQFLDAQGLDRVVLGGLSMGGYVALACARQFPERLSALILADTKAEPDDDGARAKRAEMIALAEGSGSAAVARAMLPALTFEGSRERLPQLAETVINLAASQPPATLVAALQMLRDRPDSRPGLGAINVPTLVVSGAEDKITTPQVMGGLVDGIPGSRQVVIEGAGHLANLELPVAFNAALSGFLEQLKQANSDVA